VAEVELVAVQQVDALAEAHVGAMNDARRETGGSGHDEPTAQGLQEASARTPGHDMRCGIDLSRDQIFGEGANRRRAETRRRRTR
jgi:hypothetical protein